MKKEESELKYSIQVSEKQMNIIREALDLFHRLLDGHIEDALWNLFISREVERDEFSDVCRELKKILFPELYSNQLYGVGRYDDNPHLQKMQIAYEIEAKLRHELWKRDLNAPRHVTSATPPLRYSNEPFVELEEINDDRK